jgi:small-conductance mechanosensitive channel
MRIIALALYSGAASLALTFGAVPARGQALEISEYRRLIDEREADIARLSARLLALESQADSLGRVKRGTRAGSAQYEAVSNRILISSREITGVARQLRVLYEQVRDLKTQLFLAYNSAIAGTQQQIDDLTRRGRTTENSLELRRRVDRLEELVLARERLTGEIEEAQEDLFLPQLTLDPADGPQQLRVKEAIARDAIDRIDERIAAIQDQMTKAQQRKRDLEEFRRLQDDIQLWGDDQAAQGGSEIEAILQSRVGGGAGGELFEDADVRIRELQRRRVELFDRRADYEAKAGLFARRQREFYP